MSSVLPFPHDACRGGQANVGLVGLFLPPGQLLAAHSAGGAFCRGSGGAAVAAALAVEVPQHLVVDLGGDFLLLKHFLDGLTSRAGMDGLSLLGLFRLLERGAEVRSCTVYCFVFLCRYDKHLMKKKINP